MKTTTLLRVAKAQDNYEIAQELGGSTAAHRGWEVTLLFYAALFWVRAYFEEAGIEDIPSHVQRLAAVRRTAELMAVKEEFHVLQDLSQDARYELEDFTLDRLKYARKAYDRVYHHIWGLLEPEPVSPEILEEDVD